ncbi:MAG: AAA family ATPase [Candidatus Thiodiazotropha lotti]
MKIKRIALRNFRRLENVEIDFDERETVFVGPNNSGKTSATSAFKLFLKTLDFKVHDFSVSKIADLNRFGLNEDNAQVPKIEMDLWLSIDPDIEFGRVFALLPDVSATVEEVGIRIQYAAKDEDALKADYYSAFPEQENGNRAKSLSHFLSLSNNLSRHFAPVYWTLENSGTEINQHHMDADEAKKTLGSIVRVDFVDAQRNIDDQESSRSTRLSQAFATYYKMNLEQAEVNEEANRVIDENNENLNKHYETSFHELMGVLKSLGVPSVNDRRLKIISSLSPEVALKGNTSLLYVDENYEHELPEAYNGLGFKNLVYIAIQVSHYYLQWISTETKRPLCQLIFIEEPEVHLHSQVQQTFIANIWNILGDVAEQEGSENNTPQLGVTTHSSHILDAVDFSKVRYFRRCCLSNEDAAMVNTLNASEVLSMKAFTPDSAALAAQGQTEEEVLSFLKKYMRLTHCDLFFSDGAILVEGAAEKLLLPLMIQKAAPDLQSTYLSILEVGGAYASRFAGLLEFIGIPYLVITDIDSVDPHNKRSSCRADNPDAITSNSTIKYYIGKEKVDELKELGLGDVTVSDGAGFLAFQKPTQTPAFGDEEFMYGRTFEECFIYENIELFKNSDITCGIDIVDDAETVRNEVYELIKSSTFKKTDFSLEMASSEVNWNTPAYIKDGLTWLNDKLVPAPVVGEES